MATLYFEAGCRNMAFRARAMKFMHCNPYLWTYSETVRVLHEFHVRARNGQSGSKRFQTGHRNMALLQYLCNIFTLVSNTRFLHRGRIACNAERCISNGTFACPLHAGTLSIGMKIESRVFTVR